jgi:hypothetical protein
MRRLLLILAAAALAGCVSGSYRDGSEATSPQFGEAVRANIAAHVAAAHGEPADTDGGRAALAVEKYRSNATSRTAASASAIGAGAAQN